MTLSREDMLNELCHIVEERNKLQRRRQLARSKKNYYGTIMRRLGYVKSGHHAEHHLEHIPTKYLKLPKRELKIRYKTHEAEQLLAEVELHKFTGKTTSRVRFLQKELELRQVTCSGSNHIRMLYPKNAHVAGGCTCHPPIQADEIVSRSHDHVFEAIILRDEEVIK